MTIHVVKVNLDQVYGDWYQAKQELQICQNQLTSCRQQVTDLQHVLKELRRVMNAVPKFP